MKGAPPTHRTNTAAQWETVWGALAKLNVELPYEPLRHEPKIRTTGTQLLGDECRIIHKCQKVEPTQMSMEGPKDTQTDNGIAFSHKEEHSTPTCYNVEEP